MKRYELDIHYDCPPGPIRPDAYIKEVFDHFHVEQCDTYLRFFGEWAWRFEIESDESEDEIAEWLRIYQADLFNNGKIRYAEFDIVKKE